MDTALLQKQERERVGVCSSVEGKRVRAAKDTGAQTPADGSPDWPLVWGGHK